MFLQILKKLQKFFICEILDDAVLKICGVEVIYTSFWQQIAIARKFINLCKQSNIIAFE
jgi:hypothetical protein